jgi:hypothetical protein
MATAGADAIVVETMSDVAEANTRSAGGARDRVADCRLHGVRLW